MVAENNPYGTYVDYIGTTRLKHLVDTYFFTLLYYIYKRWLVWFNVNETLKVIRTFPSRLIRLNCSK